MLVSSSNASPPLFSTPQVSFLTTVAATGATKGGDDDSKELPGLQGSDATPALGSPGFKGAKRPPPRGSKGSGNGGGSEKGDPEENVAGGRGGGLFGKSRKAKGAAKAAGQDDSTFRARKLSITAGDQEFQDMVRSCYLPTPPRFLTYTMCSTSWTTT